MFGDNQRGRDERAANAFQGVGASDRASDLSWNDGTGGFRFDYAEYWRIALKHKLLLIGSLVAAIVIGIVATLLMTPIYTATSTVQIDRETQRVFNADDGAPREPLNQGEEFLQTQYGLLRSRSLAERVIQSLGLANNDTFLETMGEDVPRAETPAARTSARREKVLEVLRDNLSVAPVRGSRLATVSFSSPDPQLSARISNAVAEHFISSNLDRKFESSRYAREFLEDRIAQTKSRLEDAERQLVAYAGNQQIINLVEADPQTGTGAQSLASSSLGALNRSLAEARASRVAAEARWRQASGSNLMSLPEVLQNPAIQRLTEEKARLQADYQQRLRTYKPDFPEMVALQTQIDTIEAQIRSIATDIRNSIRSQFTIAQSQEQALLGQVSGLTGDVIDFRNRSIQYTILQREVDTTRILYEGLLQRYKEVGVTGAVASNNISIVDRAPVPAKPSSPKLLINLIVSMLLGIGFGVVAAFILEALDETLASPEDVEHKLGFPVLGMSPLLDKGQTPLSALADLRSAFSEAYYSLRTALQFSTPDGAPATMLVTSARPAEGKSTTAYATALNLARVGKRVLLVDGDLRNPSMHRLIGVDNEVGMSNILSGSADIATAAHQTSAPNLMFIPCGPLPPNPAELWAGDRLRAFLDDARTQFDHIVIDGPPVLGFADSPLLASTMTGTLFVLEAGSTRRGQARGALRRLSMGRGRILGVVLTKFNSKATSYGGYDYAYDYNYGPGATGPKRK